MSFWIPADHKGIQLQASLDYLNAGSSPPYIKFFSGTQPAGGGAETTHVATVVLDDPAGSVIANQIVLAVPQSGLVLVDDTVTWARVFNGDDAIWGDGACTDTAGAGPFKLETTTLLAGGLVRLTSAVFS